MIELLLQAERALTMGMVDQAERLYRQAADSDPRNSIAVVGLARVALERADDAGALQEARRALAIDPENAAASRLVARLEEVLAYRGEALPAWVDADTDADGDADTDADGDTDGDGDADTDAAAEAVAAAPAAEVTTEPQRGILDRLLRRNRS